MIFKTLKLPEKKMKKYQIFFRKISIFTTLIMLGIFIYAICVMVIPEVYKSILTLKNEMPSYINKASTWMEKLFADNQYLVDYWGQYTEDLTIGIENFVKTNFQPNMNNIISGLSASLINSVAVVKNLLIGIVISIYLMSSRTLFKLQWKKLIRALFKPEISDKIITELKIANDYCSGFIKGKLLDSLIIGIICMIVLGFLKMPYAVLISVIIGVTNIVPFFGPFIGAIPSAFLILMVSPIQCLYFIIFIVILQQFDGNILGPKILGDATNLSSFWTLFAIIFFGGLMGIPGMIIGIPVFAFIYHLVKEWVNYKYSKKYPETLIEEPEV